MTATATHPVGFIGLGAMGEPMAFNLLKAGTPLLVWNRTASKCEALAEAGAAVAQDPAEVFARCEVVILMLIRDEAVDAVLARGEAAFTKRVQGRTIINMSTTAPSYSKALAADIRAAGGRYVEAPVSGSRPPAEAGQLVVMLAGDPSDVASVRPLLAPMYRDAIECGPIPKALTMKLAVNLYLINMLTGLAEATHFARSHELDLAQMLDILNAGPMACDVLRLKAAKLAAEDFDKQAGLSDVRGITELIVGAARELNLAAPMIEMCNTLYSEAEAMGYDDDDVVAVVRAIEQRTASLVEPRVAVTAG